MIPGIWGMKWVVVTLNLPSGFERFVRNCKPRARGLVYSMFYRDGPSDNGLNSSTAHRMSIALSAVLPRMAMRHWIPIHRCRQAR